MSDPIKEFTDLKKSKSKKDKAKIKLAKKMGKRRGRPASDMLQTIKIQERFDKNKISKKTDMIGDDKLTTDFQKGGRAMYKSGMRVCKLAKRGKGRAYGKNS
tara:strand:+ start:309 stop:614 length:306 start_codon:yes stop_codon:yes gene_type:complete